MASEAAIRWDNEWRRLEDLSRRHVCSCGALVLLAMHDGKPALRCAGKCGYIDEHRLQRPKSYLKQRMEYYYGQEGKPMTTQALTSMTEQQMLARIGMAKFPQDMTAFDKKVLAQAAITYGLDPLMGELTLYQGRPYVSADGRRRKAQDTGQLLGITTRPMNKAEREGRGLQDGDFGGYAKVLRAVMGQTATFEGYRVVTSTEIARAEAQAQSHHKDPWHLPLVKDPQGIAEKRAEQLALRRGFNLPLPSLEDIGGPDDEGARPPIQVRTVDTKTGEVKANGQAPVPPVEGEPEPSMPADELEKAFPREEPPPVKAARKVETITNQTQLMAACYADFGLQPKDVLRELGITSWVQSAVTPAQAYAQIAGARQ